MDLDLTKIRHPLTQICLMMKSIWFTPNVITTSMKKRPWLRLRLFTVDWFRQLYFYPLFGHIAESMSEPI